MQHFDWEDSARLLGVPARLRELARARQTLATDLEALRGFLARIRERLGAQWAGISLVDASAVEIVAAHGDFAIADQISLDESFCTLAVAGGDTLVVPDTHAHPRARHSLLVRAMEVQAYLGVPFFSASGAAIGCLSLMERRRRAWTQGEIDALKDHAHQFEDRLQPMLFAGAAAERERFLGRIRSPELRRACEDWHALAGSGRIPQFDQGVGQVLMDERFGATAELTRAAPFSCRLTRMGSLLTEALTDRQDIAQSLRSAVTEGMQGAYRQCFSSGAPTYERLAMRLGKRRVSFERLLLPFREPAAEQATHVVAHVRFAGVDQ